MPKTWVDDLLDAVLVTGAVLTVASIAAEASGSRPSTRVSSYGRYSTLRARKLRESLDLESRINRGITEARWKLSDREQAALLRRLRSSLYRIPDFDVRERVRRVIDVELDLVDNRLETDRLLADPDWVIFRW